MDYLDYSFFPSSPSSATELQYRKEFEQMYVSVHLVGAASALGRAGLTPHAAPDPPRSFCGGFFLFCPESPPGSRGQKRGCVKAARAGREPAVLGLGSRGLRTWGPKWDVSGFMVCPAPSHLRVPGLSFLSPRTGLTMSPAPRRRRGDARARQPLGEGAGPSGRG